MTEGMPVQQSYEQLRDSVENAEARAAWLDHDRRLAALTDTYRSLQDDPRYTEEHKSEQMWETFEKQGEHIQAAGQKARDLLGKEAEGHEMMSVPRPRGENIFNLSTEKFIAAQNECGRIVRKVGGIDASSPFAANKSQVLKDEYARGMRAGGAEGVAICKGTLMAADELGISEEEFLDDLRTPEQHEQLDKARRARQMAFSIGQRIPEPPIEKRPLGGFPSGTYGRGDKLIIPRERPKQLVKNPVDSWLRRS
jgi:hypothetical protein